MTSIVAEAGSSSGSFYARFTDKLTLLHALHEQFVERAVANAEALVAATGPDALTLEELTIPLVEAVVASHGENRGVIRAVLIESLRDPAFAERAGGLVRTIAGLAASTLAVTDADRDQMTKRIETGVLTLMAILDQDLFFGTALSTAQPSPDAGPTHNVERLQRVFLATVSLP